MPFTRIRRDDLLSGSVGSGSLATGSITGLPEATSADNSDLILIFDDNVSALRKMSRANFTSGISATGNTFFASPAAGKINTTGSAVFAGGQLGSSYVATSIGTDAFFFVSGTIKSRETSNTGSAVFGGDLVISGVTHGLAGLSGSLTRLNDGTSYLAAGSNITIATGSTGQVTITSTAPGTPGGSDTQVQFNDGGSFGGDAGLLYNKTSNSLYSAGVISGALGFSGSLTRLIDGTSYLAAGSNVTITSASNGQVSIAAATGITEVSEDTSPELGGQLVTADHKIAFGTGNNTSEIDFTYNGGGNFTAIASVKSIDMFLDLNGGDAGQQFRIFNNLQPASSYAGGTNTDTNAIFRVREEGNVFTKGYITSSLGFSGSLTRLADGTSYLAAGDNITITSASNGQVTIASSGGGSGVSHFSSTTAGSIFTTGSTAFVGGQSSPTAPDAPSDVGPDVFFFVSGTIGSIGTSNTGSAVFGGDTFVSGVLFADQGLSGSLTRLVDGTSYLAAGSNVTITSASSGQVTISSTAPGTPGGSDTQLQFNDGGSFGGISGATTDGSAVTFGDSGILVGQDITHDGDADTKIVFADDAIGITVGGEQLLTISEAGTDMVTVGDGGDVDFRVRTNNDDNTLYIEGSTDRIGVGTNSPTSILHIKEAAPTLTLQRENNSNASTINFIGASANTANSIIHDSSTNDLVFKTFNGSAVEEILRIGDHYGVSNRQVIILSGTTMHAAAMHPSRSTDIAFFVSGAIGSAGTTNKGAAVFGGDTVVSGALFTHDSLVRKPTRTVLQSTGSIMNLSSSMNFFSVSAAAEQSGIVVNTYDMGVTNGEYDGQEVTIMYTGSLNPTSGTYALWSSTVNYVKQVRVGAAGSNAIITLAFSTADTGVINGKTLNLIDTSGAVYSFTGSSSTSPMSPSYSAADKSVTYGVSGISTTDDAASGLSNGVSLAISNGALFNTPTVFSDGSGRIQIQQSVVGSAGNKSIAGTALSAGTIVDTGGTNAFAGGANNPNAANVNYGDSNESQAMAYLNWKSPTLRMVWDAESGKWNVITKNDTTI